MRQDTQLLELATRTQEAYLDAVTGVATFRGRSPNALDVITEEELRQYFLHLVRDRHASRSTLLVRRAGLRFLVETTLRQTWPVLEDSRHPLRDDDLLVLDDTPFTCPLEEDVLLSGTNDDRRAGPRNAGFDVEHRDRPGKEREVANRRPTHGSRAGSGQQEDVAIRDLLRIGENPAVRPHPLRARILRRVSHVE
jgi:hypothetical protein